MPSSFCKTAFTYFIAPVKTYLGLINTYQFHFQGRISIPKIFF